MMISQGWIDTQGQLFGVVHRPNNCPFQQQSENSFPIGIILMAGFSLSMCDVDYFMSKLARYLSECGALVLQMDPYGHGDSDGNLEDVTLKSLRQDIRTGIAFIRAQGVKNVFCVGRGLNATLMAECVMESAINGVVGVAPYYLDSKVIELIWSHIDSGVYDCADIISGRDYRNVTDFETDKLAFFYALGARMRNLHGQRISTRIFEDLMKYKARDVVGHCKENACWVFYEKEDINQHQIRRWEPSENESYFPLETYGVDSFQRDPLWQYHAIQKIGTWIIESSKFKSGEKR